MFNREEYEYSRQLLKVLVRSREDFQSMRKSMDNRLGLKADGNEQDRENLTARAFTAEDVSSLKEISENAAEQEKAVEKKMLAVLRKMPVYTKWLKSVKGVGTIAASHICASFDIYKADTVSRMWQYCGLNPGMVVGKVRVENKDGTYSIRKTDKMIRGDRLTANFVSPFNKNLRVALRGVLCDGFIKAKSPYAMNYYYPYKSRLEQSENTVPDGAKKELKAWRDVSKGHRDGAAKRYMLKMFIKDLYVAWRKLHGLEVREPYQAEYLGKKHVG